MLPVRLVNAPPRPRARPRPRSSSLTEADLDAMMEEARWWINHHRYQELSPLPPLPGSASIIPDVLDFTPQSAPSPLPRALTGLIEFEPEATPSTPTPILSSYELSPTVDFNSWQLQLPDGSGYEEFVTDDAARLQRAKESEIQAGKRVYYYGKLSKNFKWLASNYDGLWSTCIKCNRLVHDKPYTATKKGNSQYYKVRPSKSITFTGLAEHENCLLHLEANTHWRRRGYQL